MSKTCSGVSPVLKINTAVRPTPWRADAGVYELEAEREKSAKTVFDSRYKNVNCFFVSYTLWWNLSEYFEQLWVTSHYFISHIRGFCSCGCARMCVCAGEVRINLNKKVSNTEEFLTHFSFRWWVVGYDSTQQLYINI